MRFGWRELGPGETNHELLWLTVSLGGLAAAAAWFALHLPWPRCLFLAITGHPCITCGSTRATIQFFQGNLGSAWKWNPLAFTFLCGVTVFDLYAFAVLVARRPRLRLTFTRSEKIAARVLIVVLLGLNWVYVLAHWRRT